VGKSATYSDCIKTLDIIIIIVIIEVPFLNIAPFQNGDESRVSLSLDDETGTTRYNASPATLPDIDEHRSSSDDVATSTPHTNATGASPENIIIDAVAVSADSDGEKTETPTTPKDVTGRTSIFSKRAGITPSTPPVKDSRSKQPLAASEERPKRKGCCVIF